MLRNESGQNAIYLSTRKNACGFPGEWNQLKYYLIEAPPPSLALSSTNKFWVQNCPETFLLMFWIVTADEVVIF